MFYKGNVWLTGDFANISCLTSKIEISFGMDQTRVVFVLFFFHLTSSTTFLKILVCFYTREYFICLLLCCIKKNFMNLLIFKSLCIGFVLSIYWFVPSGNWLKNYANPLTNKLSFCASINVLMYVGRIARI